MADGEDAEARRWVRLLTGAAQSGALLDLANGSPCDPSNADRWDNDRSLPAVTLRKTLTRDNLTVGPHGLWIRGVRITGDLNLSHVELDYPLCFVECCFLGKVTMYRASVKQLEFVGTHTRSLALEGINVAGDLVANLGFKVNGQFNAFAARINGNLQLSDATFINSGAPALVLDQAEIGGSVIGQRSRITVGRSVLVGAGLKVEGQLTAHSAHIGGEFNLSGAKLSNPDGDALVLNGAEIARGLLVNAGFRSEGVLRGYGVRIGGQLDLSSATLLNPHHDAFVFDRAHISEGLFPGKGTEAGFSAKGTFRAEMAHIDGQLNLTGVQLRNRGGVALDLLGAKVTGGLVARHGLDVEGAVEAGRARIDDVELLGAKLSNPHTSSNPEGVALGLSGAEIAGDLVVGEGFDADGGINASGAHIHGALALSQATIRNPDGVALNLFAAQVAGELRLDGADIEVDGIINLTQARIGDLMTPEDAQPPGTLAATGWEIDDLHGRLRTDWCTARRWLKTAPPGEDSVQPWHAVAAVYERNGQPADGRLLRLAAAIRVTGKAPWPTKILRIIYLVVVGHGYYPLLATVWLALVVGFGAAIVAHNRADLVPTNQAAADNAAVAYAQKAHQPVPAPVTGQTPCSSHPGYPCLKSFTYALSALAPTTGITATDWNLRSDAPLWLALTFTLLRLTAWALAALLLAGVTGLLRKT